MGELVLENFTLGEGKLLGVKGEGFVDALRLLDGGRICGLRDICRRSLYPFATLRNLAVPNIFRPHGAGTSKF